MSTLETKLIESGYGERPFTDDQIMAVLHCSDASRYGLVNRALKAGTLIRIKRGVYVLGATWSRHGREQTNVHPFAIAQALKHGSYISFETALSYHGWIPEAVYQTASVTPDRKTLRYETPRWGNFEFLPLAVNDYQFLVSVRRIKFGQTTALVAGPLRALMDLVTSRKISWEGIDWITQGMRVDLQHLQALSAEDFDQLEPVYKHQAAQNFLAGLRASVLPLASHMLADTKPKSRKRA
jgi:Transcriptional regulator, AbiEi antitoxin